VISFIVGGALANWVYGTGGINSVDGANQPILDAWNKGIYGTVLNTRQKAMVEIYNPRMSKRLILDFTQADHPSRREQ
jgi:hypothetical protein